MMGILLAAAVAAETVACGGAHPPTVLPPLVPKPRVAACTGGTYRHVTTNGWSEKDWYDFDRLGLCLAETPTTCRTDDSLPHEGYRLEVRKDGVTIVSADPAGEFYARQTLRQLATLTATNAIAIPCCTIEDWPDLRMRGLFLEMNELSPSHMVRQCEVLDGLAKLKYNTVLCDFADNRKSDMYQKFAAYTSCEFIKLMLDEILD